MTEPVPDTRWRFGRAPLVLRRVAAAMAAAAMLSGCAAAAPRLVPPFDVTEQRRIHGRELPPFQSCPNPPEPPEWFERPSFYTDPAFSVLDPRLHAEAMARVAPLRGFGRGAAELSDAYVRDRRADPARAACALDWLADWAARNALVSGVAKWSNSDRAWFVIVNASVSLMKIDGAPGLDPEKLALVRGWLRRLTEDLVARTDRNLESTRGTDRYPNNHSLWTAAAAVTAGIATGDRPLFARGVVDLRVGLEAVDDKGFLPAEMQRRGRALSYLQWAAQPLAIGLLHAQANGEQLLDVNDRAFARFMAAVARATRDPAIVEQATGEPQEPGAAAPPHHLLPPIPPTHPPHHPPPIKTLHPQPK
ncbi:MAG: alginate lyase family protein, partial [Allosphingosinicella sp.]|uniref:alginate lyase family protein n=1 Tax=Allosphingosinicella sp. TaxID=2823234 RepID=UPI0039491F64